MSTRSADGQRVVVVTGGGGGIGAAIAEELGRRGDLVVTVDPLVSVDGSEVLPPPEETTAGRIVAAGGAARSSSASVADRDAIDALFGDLVEEHGRLDVVINVAGISRPTSFARGSEEDWRAVLSVHLDGYLNVLGAALPIMAGAGRGHILGVTSGSGWRPADAGAYACAKRAVASLTWQLGQHAPAGVIVNAISPIAVTRMVTAALARARPKGGAASRPEASPTTGGLSLGTMPAPADLAPFGSHLVDESFDWCRGQVLFAGGSEVAVIGPPRLLEVVRTGGVGAPAPVLDAVTAGALVPAEAGQASSGAGNPRFDATYAADANAPGVPAAGTCAVVTAAPALGTALVAALEARGVACAPIAMGDVGPGFGGASAALDSAAGRLGSLDAVVVAPGGGTPAPGRGWEAVLADHRGLADRIRADAAWARAVADRAGAVGGPIRLVTLVDASTPGGCSRAQASAQLSRVAHGATKEQVRAFTVAVEVGADAAEIGAHLVAGEGVGPLSGAELVAAEGWLGLRSHPCATGSVVLGGTELPDWFDGALRRLVGAPPAPVGD